MAFRFREITGTIGESDIEADGLLSTASGLAGTRFAFRLAGPEMRNLVESIGELDVRPGPYEFSGSIELQPNLVSMRDIALDREFGDLKVNLDLGLPVSRSWADFEIRGNGDDIRSVLRGAGNLELEEQSFALDVTGSLRGTLLTYESFNIRIGDATVQASGDLQLESGTASTEFSYALDIPDLANVGTWKGEKISSPGSVA